MIVFIILSFLCLVFILCLLISYDLKQNILDFFRNIIPGSIAQLKKVFELLKQLNLASSAEHTQSSWHIQQWWILVSSFFLFGSILIFAFTRPINPTKIEANYLKETDPQIYTLLKGEMLSPPPEVEESLVNEAIVSAMKLEQSYSKPNPISGLTTDSLENDGETQTWRFNTDMIDRKWNRLNPRYKQRLLMVFKIMKERYNYELVLLEGYRSPERQNMLSGNIHTTRAKAYQSYHQFGLAADVAFKRDGKVVISERDPWAMQGYKLYGEVAESVGLTWGGRWTSIQDYGHTEYRMPGLKKTAEMAEKLSSEGQMIASN